MQSSSRYNPNDIIPINPRDPRITEELRQKAQKALLELHKFLVHLKVNQFDVNTKKRIKQDTWIPVCAKFVKIGDRILSERIIFTVAYRSIQGETIFLDVYSERREAVLEFNLHIIVYKAQNAQPENGGA